MSKPREWWLRPWTDAQPDGFLSGKVAETTSYDVETEAVPDSIHVIERSAYEKAVAALKLLGHPENWGDELPYQIIRRTLKELGEL